LNSSIELGSFNSWSLLTNSNNGTTENPTLLLKTPLEPNSDESIDELSFDDWLVLSEVLLVEEKKPDVRLERLVVVLPEEIVDEEIVWKTEEAVELDLTTPPVFIILPYRQT